MYTGVVFGITMLIIGFLITLVALQLFVAALMPAAVDRAEKSLERPWLSLLTGSGVALALVVFIAIANAIQLPALGAFGFGITVLYAMIGLAALSRKLGRRMPSPADAGRPWRATLRGAITLSLASAAPFVGWLAVLPLALIAGAGATTNACLARLAGRSAQTTPTAAPTAADALTPADALGSAA